MRQNSQHNTITIKMYNISFSHFQLNVDGRGTDLSLLAYDCFHMSQKGNA